MGERRRVGVELTTRSPPGERLSLGECRAGFLIADDWLSKRIDVDWWEGGLTSPGVRDLRSWRLVHSATRNDSGHPSANSSSIFAAGRQDRKGYHRPLQQCRAVVVAAAAA